MESVRQHSTPGIGEDRCCASPMVLTELQAEAVELPGHLGPDPESELERVRVVWEVTPSLACRGSIGSDAGQPALSDLVSEGDTDPIDTLERQLATPCLAHEVAERGGRLQRRQERPTEPSPRPVEIGSDSFEGGFVESVVGEPLVDALRAHAGEAA